MSSTATISEVEASSSNPSPRQTRTSGGQKSETAPKPVRDVHFVMQGKGGVGKTWVASLLAQYLREHGKPPICFDTDPVNASLVQIKALQAEPVLLIEDDAININAVDAMMERIVKEDAEIVVDNGAASFVPLSNYLISDNVAAVIAAAGKQMVVHIILVGGGSVLDTANGLEAVLTQFPPSVRVVVWINEYFGAVAIDGTAFTETNFYAQHSSRLTSIVHLRAQNPKTTGINLAGMAEAKKTFAEVLSDPDVWIMPKQRLTQYRQEVWGQLDTVL